MAWLHQPTNSWNDLPKLLTRRLAGLQHEAQQLGHALGGYRHEFQHGAHDVGDVLLREGVRLAGRIGRGATRAGKAVSRDPVPALAMVVAAGCLLSLMTAKPRRR